jgi:Transcription factor WhiB
MLSTLGPTRVSLIDPTRRPRPLLQAAWIGPHPTSRTRSPALHRVRLADGVWIIPQQGRPPGVRAKVGRRLDPPEWMAEGLCARLTPKQSDALFFGVDHREAPATLIAASNAARQICQQCPVAATCLTNALVGDERYGVWGGTSGRQRAKLRIRLERGAIVEDLVAEYLNPKENPKESSFTPLPAAS